MNKLAWLILAFWAIFSVVLASPLPSPVARAADDSDIPEVTQVPESKSGKDDSKSQTTDIPDASSYNSKDDDKKTSSKAEKKSDDDKKSKSDDEKSKSDDDDKKKTTSMSINPQAPVGTINMETPGSTESTYIKIGQKATFKWKYESLSVTPKNIDILATCSLATQSTITLTKSHSAEKTEYVWDTKKTDEDNDVELLTAKYSLLIFDSKGNMSMTPQPGYLSPLSFAIGLYRGEKYTPMAHDSDYVNEASLADTTVLKWVVAMSAIVFVSGLQVILS